MLLRKVLVAVAVLSWGLVQGSLADEVRWFRSPEEAVKAMEKAQRPLFVYARIDGCVYCEKMQQTTLRDEKVVKLLNSKFTPLFLDAERFPGIANQLRIEGYPTSFVITSEGELLAKFVGYTRESQLASELEKLKVGEKAEEGASAEKR